MSEEKEIILTRATDVNLNLQRGQVDLKEDTQKDYIQRFTAVVATRCNIKPGDKVMAYTPDKSNIHKTKVSSAACIDCILTCFAHDPDLDNK